MHSLQHFPFHVEHVRNPRHGAVLDAAKEIQIFKVQTRLGIGITALAGNRTRVNCLEGSYSHHYNTNLFENTWKSSKPNSNIGGTIQFFSFSPISSLKSKGDSRVTALDSLVPWCNG